jgi:YVTN family beta-propeller protein
VAKIDPAAGRVVDTVNVGRGPGAIAIGADAVWVANVLDGTVSRIDPAAARVTRTIPVGEGPVGLTAGPGSVWVTSELAQTISRIDPAMGTVADAVRIAGRPTGVAATSTGLFVAVRSAGGAHRGGTLTALMAMSPPVDSIDPAITFDTVTSGLLSMAYDGLTAFRRVGGRDGTQLVPDLAASLPQPADKGKSYTFRLRPGIRYSTGELVRPADFRRAFERLFELRSPSAYEYTAIVGAQPCLHRPIRCDLSRGILTDDPTRTVTFQLTKPDTELPYKLALLSAVPVPPSMHGPATGRHPLPATGAYMIASYLPGHQLRFVRNPRFREWSHAARPTGYPDQLVFNYGAYRPQQLRAVIAGQADFIRAPTTELAKLRARYPSRLHSNIRLGAWYVFLNTRLRPFSDERARQAVSYAVDRQALTQAAGGPLSAQPTCQVLPPNFPGHQRYCPYRHDLTTARRLVAASGTRGMPVVVWSPSRAVFLMSRIVSALNALGYHARLKVDDGTWNYHNIQAGPHSWFTDYPAAANFAALFSCGSPTLANPSQFCDPAIQRAIARALHLESADPRAANDLWARIDRMVTDRAPYVPLLNPRRLDFVSARVGNYQSNPQWGTLFDQLWVR